MKYLLWPILLPIQLYQLIMNGCEDRMKKDVSAILEDVMAQLINMDELELEKQLKKALDLLK